jgi:hypothetical protein
MKQVALVGFHSRVLRESVKTLKQLGVDEYDISLWFGSHEADFKTSSIKNISGKSGKKGHIADNDEYHGTISNLLIHDEIRYYKIMYRFIDHQMRLSRDNKKSGHVLENMHDYQHYFHLTMDMVAHQLAQRNIDIVVFSTTPHLAYDTIVYEAARLLNIRTIMIDSSVLPDKFFSMEKMSDCGKMEFDQIDAQPYIINKNEQLEHFYMKDDMQSKVKTGRLDYRDILLILIYVIRRSPSLLKNISDLRALVKRAAIVKSKFPHWRDPFNEFFHIKQLSYFEALLNYEFSPPDFNQDFVYFPLQYQPEMNTSCLGGVYVDQVLAIEHLSSILPDGYKIFVKENPKQQHQMREPLFFNRLNRIDDVVFVPSYTNTHECLERAKFAATITGTVGWEAIRQGKSVVCFGNPWYQSLPGVIKYHSKLTFKEIDSAVIDHDELQRKTGELVSRMHDGVPNSGYDEISKKTKEQSSQSIAKNLHNILVGKDGVTFKT